MAEIRTLREPPIAEALADLRVKNPTNVSAADFNELRGQLADLGYPNVQEQRSIKFEITEGKPQPPTIFEALGLSFKSADGRQIAQFTNQGFTVNQLAPYMGWETLRAEVLKLWPAYVSIAGTEQVSRIALRYINRLELPLPVLDFGEYLTAPPVIPDGLPQGLIGFLIRLSMTTPGAMMANVSQALDIAAVTATNIAVVLDVDVYELGTFSIDEKELAPMLDRLRDFKNEIFFRSVTEKLLARYE